MEWLAIILSGIFAAISPTGVILDSVAEKALRSQVARVEELAVRIDNTPSYQVIQGKIDRIRLASRGIEPIADIRIAAIDLETDPLNVDLERLQQVKSLRDLRTALRQPFQGAVRLVVKEKDINQALQSPNIKAQLQKLVNGVIPQQQGSPIISLTLLDVRVEFLGNNRTRIEIRLQPDSQGEPSPPLEMVLEAGFKVTAGRTLQILEPEGTLNGRRLSGKLLQGFAEGFSEDYLDLRKLEAQGATARILRLNISDEEMDLAMFVRVVP